MGTDNIEFVQKELSSSFYDAPKENIDFTVLKNGEVDSGKKFVKFSARFRYGKQTFVSTYWKPGGEDEIKVRNMKALVFICHGFAESLNYSYEEVARFWCTELGKDDENTGGCLVFGHDHVGHGRTSGPRVSATKMNEYVYPIVEHIKSVKEWYFGGLEKQLPIYLVGHSMGALIAIFVLFKHQTLFRGFIALSPLIKLDMHNISRKEKFLLKYLPSLCVPHQVGSFSCEEMTRDKKMIKKMNDDNIFWHGGSTVGHDALLIRSCENAIKNLSKITLPILVLQGEDDEYENPKGAKALFDGAVSEDKLFVSYPKALHHLLIEVETIKLDVFKKTLEWMSRHVKILPKKPLKRWQLLKSQLKIQ
jgi:acylglycerol lipase